MFLTHVRKELRQNLSTFGALLLLVLVGTPAFTWIFFCVIHPEWNYEAAEFAGRVALVAGVTALFALGDAAVPELREGNAPLVLRLPGALLPSYVARAFVLVLGTATVTAIAHVVTAIACAAVGDRIAFGLTASDILRSGASVSGVAALAATCTLATVGGLRRGALALPATLVLAACVVVPVALAIQDVGARPKEGDLTFACVVLVVAAAAAGWVAFRGTFIASRGPVAGLWRGAVALLLLSAPIPALGALRHHEWTTASERDDLRFVGGYVARGGHRAFLVAQRDWDGGRWQRLNVAVDLDRGTVERLGGEVIAAGFLYRGRDFDRATHDVVGVLADDDTWALIDADSGREIGRQPGGPNWRRLPAAVLARVIDDVRATAPLTLADGRSAWIADNRVQTFRADGSLETIALPADFVPRRGGHGRLVVDADGHALDLHTMTVLDAPRHGARPCHALAVGDRGVFWLRPYEVDPRRPGDVVWIAWDDVTPKTLRLPGGESLRFDWPAAELVERDGRLVLVPHLGHRDWTAVDVDPASGVATPLGPPANDVLGVDADGWIYAISRDQRRVHRVSIATRAFEVLFPRPE